MSQSHMAREIAEIPAAATAFLDLSANAVAEGARRLAALDPCLIATVARGSSDHAATYLKYAIELATGVPVASIGPSVASVYGRQPKLRGAACIGISQSGKSPDIVEMMTAARSGGALTVAITNDAASPMAGAVDCSIPLHAGQELSVAATKTFALSVLAGLSLLAEWTGDTDLKAAIARSPDDFRRALAMDWAPLSNRLVRAQSLFVLGRGAAYAIANECALKFKETCGIHAESYSAAEVLHGPAAIVQERFPVLALCVDDAARPHVIASAERLASQGADVFVTGATAKGAVTLPGVDGVHPLLAPLVLAVGCYAFLEPLARWRGFDPDAPPHLRKVTETI